MRKFNVLMFLLFTLAIVNFQSCKKSTFTEEDAIKLQQQTLVDYTITLVSADETHLISNYMKSASAMNGAVVKVTQGDLTVTKTADASGILVFPNLKLGSVNVNIKASGYSEINYVVDLLAMDMAYTSTHTSSSTSDEYYSNNTSTDQNSGQLMPIVGGSRLGNIVAMIPNSGTSMATIQGKVTFESDLTNTVPETAPAGTKVIAILVGSNSGLMDAQGSNYITSFSYDSLDMQGATDATGGYSIKVPATADGLSYKLVVPDFSANQQIIMNTLNGDTVNSVQTIPAYFGTSFTNPSNVPTTTPVNITIAAPGYTYTPAVAGAVIDNINGISNVQLVSNGAYYAAPGGGSTYYTLNIDTPRILASTFSNVTGKGTVQISVNSDGRIAQTNVNSNGSKYLATAENADFAISYIQQACRGTIVIAADTTVNVTNNGQFLSTSMDALEVYNITKNGSVTGFTPHFSWNAGNYQLASIDKVTHGTGFANGDIIGIRVKASAVASQVTGKLHMTKGYVSAINVTSEGANYKTGKVFVEIIGGGGTDATATATVSADGRIIAVTVDAGKNGTNYTSAPTVNILSTVNNVTAKATASVSADGVITAITVNKAGDGYYTIPSVTIASAASAGSGAIAKATISGGKVTGISVVTGGSGYTAKNIPGASIAPTGKGVGSDVNVQTNATILGDIYLGTGKRTIEK